MDHNNNNKGLSWSGPTGGVQTDGKMASLRERRLNRTPSAQQVLSGAVTAAAANANGHAGPQGRGGEGSGSLGAPLVGGLSLKSPLAQVKAMGSTLVRVHSRSSDQRGSTLLGNADGRPSSIDDGVRLTM